MLTHDENELLCRTGPGTPMGNLMRRYWIPALFSHQLPERDGAPLRTMLLGERLVAFRDSQGRVGILAENCAHRGASLFFGRNEEDGLRCVYHGWKYDVSGQCVDMPSEPPESTFKERIRMTAYPCAERGGVIYTYMGPPELQPASPEWEWTLVPESHVLASRRWQESNWLQAVEGGVDPSHIAFLHRGDNTSVVRGYRPASSASSFAAPQEPVPTDCGLMMGTGRPGTGRAPSHFMMPFYKIVGAASEDAPIGAHAWVPIDDHNCMLYSWEWHNKRPLNDEEMEPCVTYRSIHAETFPGSDRTILNQANDYLIDRELQRSGMSFTGIKGVGMQDSAMQESMGPIQDHSQEHLGSSDLAIIVMRRYLLRLLREPADDAALPGLDPASHRRLSTIHLVA
jgi:phenylpropionate dioxygenase-like ring-hydroxylating dioxygenase large terminal subunit